MEILKKINNLRKLSPAQVTKKIINKSYEVFYYKYRKIKVSIKPIEIKSEKIDNFKSSYRFFVSVENKNFISKQLKNLKLDSAIINDADKICSHIFNLLGSGDVDLDTEIPWNKDFKSGFVWENRFYKDIKIVDLNNNADVKVPWELSRFQHLFTLGKAYWLTSDEKYTREFIWEIVDWIKKNPVEMSVNWTCTMDVGIRAVNWIAAYSFFKESKELSNEFLAEFNRSLYLHGQYIKGNLENKGSVTGNHYLSNIVGLIWLGIYFKELSDDYFSRQAQEWLHFGLEELEKEMFVQNNPDGTNYEASTSYHRLVTELFLITTILCNRNGIFFSKSYMLRLEKMCEFIVDITKPNGLVPIIGDADDGRLLIISNYGCWLKNDFRHLLGIAGELFNRTDFKYYGQDYKEDVLWIYNKIHENIQNPAPLESKSYSDGGYYILRDDRVYCCIRCGELSFHGEGIHSHNDQLSFELNVDGEDFIIDPGSYIYTADYKARNHFRSTKMHNTVQVENYEQNDFEEKNLFYMKEQTFAMCRQFEKNLFHGLHKGFHNKLGIIHERMIFLNEETIVLKDILNSNNEETSELKIKFNILLDPEVTVYFDDNQIVLSRNKTSFKLIYENIQFKALSEVNISNAYGILKKSSILLFESKNINNFTIQLIL